MITYQTSLILKLDFIYRWTVGTNIWNISFQSGHTERQTILLIIIIPMPPVLFSCPTLVRYIFYFIFNTYKGTDKRFICYNGHPSTMALGLTCLIVQSLHNSKLYCRVLTLIGTSSDCCQYFFWCLFTSFHKWKGEKIRWFE